AVERLIEKCLAKEPAMRYASMEELRQAVLELPSSVETGQKTETFHSRTGSHKRRKLNKKKVTALRAILILPVVCGAIISFGILTKPNPIEEATRTSYPPKAGFMPISKKSSVSVFAMEKDQLANLEQKNQLENLEQRDERRIALETAAKNGDTKK